MNRRTITVKKAMSEFSTQKIVSNIIRWGTQIVFLVSLAILSYLSFVDSFEIKPSLRSISMISLVALVLNWVVWDSWHTSTYEKSLFQDRTNKEYSVHRRYYHARRGWKYNELQNHIRQYNINFVKTWETDVEDITGRSIESIRTEPYKGHDHKLLIHKIKHHNYPKSGIRTPKDLLYVLSVLGSDSMKLDVHKAERMHSVGRVKKLITSALSTLFAASIAVNFVKGEFESAALTLLINVAILFTSLFFGAMSGAKAAKVKLSIAEEVSEMLEEWRDTPPSEEPYVEHKVFVEEPKPIVEKVEEKQQGIIEIT